MLGIQEGAKKIGINSEAYHALIEELVSCLKTGKKPIIAHLKTNHFVIVYKVWKNKLYISDPACGKYSLTPEKFQNIWSGYLIMFSNQKSDKGIQEKRLKTHFFISLLLRKWKYIICIMITSFLLLTASVFSAFVFQMLMDHGSNLMYDNGNIIIDILTYLTNHKISKLFMFMGLLAVMTVILSMVKGKVEVTLTRQMDIAFMDEYIAKIFRTRLSEIFTRTTGDYITRMSDLESVRELISGILVSFFMNASLFILGSILLLRINGWLYAVAVITLTFYAILVVILHKPFEVIQHSVMSANAGVQTYFKETLQGIELIKANNVEDIVHSRLMDKYRAFKSKVYKGNILGICGSSVSTFVNQISNLIIIFAGFEFVDRRIMSLGELMTFFMLLSLLSDSAIQLVAMQQRLQGGFVSIDRLRDIMYLEDEAEGEVEIDRVREIRLDHVGFSYFDNPMLFHNISFTLSENKKLAIVGENGCGKSTLLRIIMGMERASVGQVCINGMNISRIRLKDVRERMAFVTQTPFMFADTLLRNVTLGKDYPIEEVVEVCMQAGLEDLLMQSPHGLDMFIEENATNLSSGQKQSVALARALIKKPDVLILDEATSNMDAERENKVISYLLGMDNLCIFVTHNHSIVEKADYIIRMKGEKA